MSAQPGRRLLVLAPSPPRLDATHGSARAVARLLLAHAQRNRVALLALRRDDEPGVDETVATACEFVQEVERVAVGRSLGVAWRERQRAAAIVRGRPLWVASVDTRAYRPALRALSAEWRPDVVQAELGVMGLYLDDVPRPARRVLVEHDPGVRASGTARTTAGWRRHLRAAVSSCDAVVVFSDEDRAVLSAVAPQGTRIERISLPWPAPPETALDPVGSAPPTVLFIGSFRHPPNVEAARRLIALLPQLRRRRPDVVLALVGEEPPEDFAREHVEVPGRVADVGPWLERAAVVAVPLTSGGGVRLKVVEALAAGKAVVGMPLAFEGLDLVPGREVLVGADEDALVIAIGGALDDPAARRRLGAAARIWAARLPDAAEVGAAYDALYRSLGAP